MKTGRHPAADHFSIVDGELAIAGTPLSRLVARVGRTPFYAYDRNLLTRRVDELRAMLPTTVQIHYAIKANPMPALVGHLARQIDGFDVASAAELRVALDTGISPHDVSFAGPGKTDSELAQAVASGVLLNVESIREIRAVAEAVQRTGCEGRIAVRINPDFELKSLGLKMGGGPRQFGIDAEAVPAALAEIAKLGLLFEGFHIFSGSQNLSAEAICDAQSQSLAMAVRLANYAPAPVAFLNLGGGLGIPYFPNDKPVDLSLIGSHLHKVAEDAAHSLPQAQLVIELGRYLVGEAGVYVCKILDRKVSRGEVFLVADGGLHHHLAATGNFGQWIRKNYPMCVGNRMNEMETEVVSVVGPLCTPLDLIGDRVELACATAGDFLVVFQSGAYGFTASPHLFLSHPEPIEVLI